MPSRTSLNLIMWDVLNADHNGYIMDQMMDMMGPSSGSNIRMINDLFVGHNQQLASLAAQTTVYIMSAALQSGGTTSDTYTSSYALSGYDNKQLYTLSFDNNNTIGPSTININNLGDLAIKKVDDLGNRVDMEAGDIVKNNLYQFTIDTATNEIILVGKSITKDLQDLQSQIDEDIADLETAVDTKADATTVYTKQEIIDMLVSYLNFNGNVDEYAGLPSVDVVVGDMYKVIDGQGTIPDNTIVMWNGTDWVMMGGAVQWVDILNKPTEFTPAEHTQEISSITGLTAALASKDVTVNSIAPVNGNITVYATDVSAIPLKEVSTAGEFDKTADDPTDTVTRINFNGNLYATNIHGAVWNDIAESRAYVGKAPQAGQVMVECGNDYVMRSTRRLLFPAGVVSDTYGYTMGPQNGVDLAIAGRVLAYTDKDASTFHIGDAVCSGPDGTVSRMTKREVRKFPQYIVGYVSAFPEYEHFGTGNVAVDGRIWIKVV